MFVLCRIGKAFLPLYLYLWNSYFLAFPTPFPSCNLFMYGLLLTRPHPSQIPRLVSLGPEHVLLAHTHGPTKSALLLFLYPKEPKAKNRIFPPVNPQCCHLELPTTLKAKCCKVINPNPFLLVTFKSFQLRFPIPSNFSYFLKLASKSTESWNEEWFAGLKRRKNALRISYACFLQTI